MKKMSFLQKSMFFLLFLLLGSVGVNAQITPFNMTLTPTNETCVGNGEIEIDITGTQNGAEFEFQLYQLPNTITPIRVTNNVLATGTTLNHIEAALPDGNYSVVAVQVVGTESNQQTETVSINDDSEALSYTLSQTTFCSGSEITVSVNAGYPVTYELRDENNNIVVAPQTSNVFSNIAAGDYNVIVSDTCGNSVSQGITATGQNVTYSLLRETTQLESGSLYGFSVLDGCNSIKHKELLSANGNTTIPSYYFPINLTITQEDPTGGPDTVINTTWNSNADNDEEFLLPFYSGETYNYTVDLVDNCGNTFSLTNSVTTDFDYVLNSFGTFCENSNLTVRRYWFGTAPYEVEFLNYPAGFTPWTYHSQFPTGSFVGTGVTGWLQFGSSNNTIPTGTYEVKVTDACGRTVTKTQDVDPQSLNHNLNRIRGEYGGCDKNEGAIRMYVKDSGIPQVADIITANLTAYPSTYTGPTDVSSSITSNGWIVLADLPVGDYTLQTTTDCGTSPSKDFTVTGVETASDLQFNYNCSSFNLDYTLTSNLYSEKAYLQRFNETTGQWEHPLTGMPYTDGDPLTNATGLFILEDSDEVINVWTTQPGNNYTETHTGNLLNITSTGNFRVIVEHNNFVSGQQPDDQVATCFTIADTFSITDERLTVENYYVASCANGNNELIIEANGNLPLNYSIIEFNGTPTTIDNGTDPVFSDLAPGTYKVEIEDACGNVSLFSFKTDVVKQPVIRPNNLCVGQDGYLFVAGLSFLDIEWTKGTDPTILATGNTLYLNQFDPNTDVGTYYAHLSYSPNPNACIAQTISFEVQNPQPAPEAGTGQTVTIVQQNAGVINLFDYVTGPYDDYGDWSNLSNTGVLNNEVLDASTLPVGSYQFQYEVGGTCSGTDTTVVTINIIPSALTAVDDTFTDVCSEAQTNIGNVMDNDTEGGPVVQANYTITTETPDPDGVITVNTDGSIDVAANAQPGQTYTLQYRITEIANTNNFVIGNLTVTTILCCVYEVTCPTFGPLTLECYAEVPTQETYTIAEFEALGNGDGLIGDVPCGIIEITANNSADSGTCPQSVTRTYTVTEYEDTNNNGVRDTGEDTVLNTTDCTQTITVEDTTAPTFDTTPPTAPITVSCSSDIPNDLVITASDNCDTEVEVFIQDIETAGSCPGNYTIERTYIAVDACGNTTTSAPRMITVEDTTAPTFNENLPQDITLSCEATIPTAETLTGTESCVFNTDAGFLNNPLAKFINLGDAMAGYDTNNGSPFGVVFQNLPVLNYIDNPTNLDQTYFSGVTFSLETYVIDSSLPSSITTTPNKGIRFVNSGYRITFSSPQFASTEGNVQMAAGEKVNLNSDDPDASMHFDSTYSTDYPHPNFYLKPTATGYEIENRGTTNINSIYQIFSGANITEFEIESVGNSGPTYFLYLFNPLLEASFEETTVEGSCANNYDLVRTWTIADDCGNETVHTQTVTVEDTTAPTFDTIPPTDAITVSCTEDIPAAASITATDTCGEASVHLDETRIDGACFGQYTIERRWVAIDECGNQTISDPQIITVNDQTGPTFNETLPEDLTLECTDEIPTAAELTATDCTIDVDNDTDNNFRLDGALTLNILEAMNGYDTNNGDAYGVVGTWLVNDYLYDHVPGTSGPPTPIPTSLPEYNGVTFTITTVNLATGSQPHRVYPDNFGTGVDLRNARIEIVFSSDVHFAINGEPNLRAQEYAEFSGDGNIFVPYPNVGSHNIAGLISSTTGPYYMFNPVQGNINANTITGMRSIYSGYGTQLNVDHRHPVESTPGYMPLYQLELFPQQDLVEFNEKTVAGDCPGNYDIVRTWTATDECGNATTHVQTITVEDTTAPVFNEALPVDVTVECDAMPTAEVLTASDNCTADQTVIYEETITDGACANSYSIERTWTATDECGNASVHTQTITVEDTTAPVFNETLPIDVTVECDAIPTAEVLTAMDNCTADQTVVFEETITDGACANSYSIERTWTATDECGNATTHVQTITVEDTTAPVFNETLPTDVTVECDAIPTAEVLTATDNCTTNQTVVYEETITDGSCANSYTIERTWTATDECGNASVHTQTIIVEDTTAPVFNETLPTDVTVECDAIPTAEVLTASDNCTADQTVVYEETITDGACANSYTIERTWTATDECGNATTHVQTITVKDTTAPTFNESLPFDTINLECSEDIPVAEVLTASDNCGAATVSLSEVEIAGNCFGNYTIERTWTATDECGNTTAHVQNIVIADTTAPQFLSPLPENITVACNTDLPAPANLAAVDNCNGPVDITYEEQEIDLEGISKEVIRTWTATDECGNATSYEQIIQVDCDDIPVLPCDIVVYNAVSPNGDGINDYFIIDGAGSTCAQNLNVAIYNRWGVKIYETDNYGVNGNVFTGVSNGRGTINSGEQVPSGTYFYILNYQYEINNQTETYQKAGYLYLNGN